jgi:phosphate transporter
MSATLGKITTKLTNLKDSITSSPSHEPTIWTSRSDYAYDIRLLYKRRITNLYISFTNLRSYTEINYSGFRKIIKKYDKVMFSEVKDKYLHEVVERATPFTQASKDKLNEAINRLTDLYTKCVSLGDRSLAVQQLRLHQRENIAWERDTVWRQMIGRERRGEGDTLDAAGAVLANPPEPAFISIYTPVGRLKITKKYVFRVIAVVVFIILLNTTVLEEREANKCLAILTFCTILWATEVCSSSSDSDAVQHRYASVHRQFHYLLRRCSFPCSLSCCVSSVTTNTLRCLHQKPQGKILRLSFTFGMCCFILSRFVFSTMFSPTIMLLIGGFTISSALSKTNIDRVIVTRVLSLAGTRPSTLLLAFMAVSCFASMWIRRVIPHV